MPRRGWRYYRDKLLVLGLTRLSPHRRFGGTVVTNAGRDLAAYRAIVFYLGHPLMHLGDQFYFKPLARRLRDFHARVVVQPHASLDFFFAGFEREIRVEGRILVVSRVEVAPDLPGRFGPDHDFFLIDTSRRAIDRHVSNYLLGVVEGHFGLSGLDRPIARSEFVDFDLMPFERDELSRAGRVLVLGNYVESGRFRVTRRRREALLDALRAGRGGDGVVVHVGTAADREGDPYDYRGLVDLDLRGRTTVRQLFDLMALSRIDCAFCHDTAVLHIAGFLGRRARVVCKRYFLPGEQEQKRRAFVPIFDGAVDTVEVLDPARVGALTV